MKILNWIKNNSNRAMFLVPIILVAVISISHVVTWYDIANPFNWAIYLSVAIEIAAMTALVAVSTRVKGGVWFMFSLVTLIQIIGNVFFCFKEIDENGELFKYWVELTLPIWDLMGTDVTDTLGMKRWLALLEGGLLPIISLTSLHFFVNYEKRKEDEETDYLPSTEDNKEHLEESIKQVEEIMEEEINTGLVDNKEEEINTGLVDNKEEEVKLTKPVTTKTVKVDTSVGKVNKIQTIRKDIGNSGSKNIQRID